MSDGRSRMLRGLSGKLGGECDRSRSGYRMGGECVRGQAQLEVGGEAVDCCKGAR